MKKKMNKEETKEELFSLLGTRRLNTKGNHLIGDCPFCGKKSHLYVNWIKAGEISENTGRFRNSWDCKKCGESGNVSKLLWKLGKESEYFKKLKKPKVELELVEGLSLNGNKTEEDEENFSSVIIPEVKPKRFPTGFKRLYRNEYLESRGLNSEDFLKYEIGRSLLRRKYEDYLLIGIKEKGVNVGFFGRKIPNSKGDGPRYNNSSINTSHYLMGLDEINFLTQYVVITEGFFDKVVLEKALGANKMDSEFKICASLGKNLSLIQQRKIMSRGVDKIIISYDPEAIIKTKKIIPELRKNGFEVFCSFLKDDRDWGDFSGNEKEALELFYKNLKRGETFTREAIQLL